MKNKLLLFVAILFATFAIAQTATTTPEEYKYLTEEYEYIVTSGGNLKEGYRLDDIKLIKLGDYVYNFKGFVKEDTGKTQAILCILTKIKRGSDKVLFLCIPFGSAELFGKFQGEYDKLGLNMTIGFDTACRIMVSELANGLYNSTPTE